MPNHYRNGRNREWKVRDALIDAGYTVLRTAGSKGALDLLAIKPGQWLFVQVKTTTAPGPASWNALYDLALMADAVPVLATCPPRQPITYHRLTARKEGRGRAPMVPFLIDLAD
jgi:Holliday junction resolvase